MRIVVVEDEPALRTQLALALRAAGHTVDVAADGTEQAVEVPDSERGAC